MDVTRLLDQVMREHSNNDPKQRYLYTTEIMNLLGLNPQSFFAGVAVGQKLQAEVNGPWEIET